MQALSTGIRWWFESMDHARRERGAALDRIGYGPQESPFHTVLSAPGMRLRRYGRDNGAGNGRVALIVPAPIKRHYIWDLAPDCSVVRRALEQGLQVYLIEWTNPSGEETSFGLQEYGYRMINECVDAIQALHPAGKIFFLGHSLGGVLSAIYAAVRPKRVAGLVLIEAPLHFAEATGSFGPLVAFGPPARSVTQLFRRVPGTVLNLASTVASPATFNVERYADFVASLGSQERMNRHLLVQRWTMDEAPMAGQLFEQTVEWLYREDAFMRGTLTVNGIQLSPEHMVSPLLSVYDPNSVIIPPASVIAFHRAAGAEMKRLLAYEGDTGVALAHVGALIGDNAHRRLWPQVFDWMAAASAAHGAPH